MKPIIVNRNQKLESEIERSICRGMSGFIAVKLKNRHMSDRMFLFPQGRVVFIEIKRPKGPTKIGQQLWCRQLQTLGFEAHICDDIDQMKRILVGYGAREIK